MDQTGDPCAAVSLWSLWRLSILRSLEQCEDVHSQALPFYRWAAAQRVLQEMKLHDHFDRKMASCPGKTRMLAACPGSGKFLGPHRAMDQMGDHKLNWTFNDEITKDVIFSVASSQEGDIDIKVGCSIMHVQKHCSTDIPTIYEAGWVRAKSHSTKSRNEDAISDINPQKVDCQTDMSNFLSLPVLFVVSIKSETLISKVPGSNKTQEYGSTGNAGTFSVVMVSNPIESIGSMQFASSNTGTVSDSMQLYCRPDGTVNSVWVQDPEEQQYILKNPGNEQNDLPCALYQPIHCSKCPDASEVLIGNMKLAHLSVRAGAPLNSSGYGDSKMYALVTPQSRRAGDGGSSSTGTLVPPRFWLDSGATHHVVGDHGILTNLRDPPAGMVVTVADGSQHPVTKVGDIQTPDMEITNVYLVPGLEMCLVSVRQLAKSKVVTTFYENHAELWLEGTQIGGAIIDDAESLYRLRFLQAP